MTMRKVAFWLKLSAAVAGFAAMAVIGLTTRDVLIAKLAFGAGAVNLLAVALIVRFSAIDQPSSPTDSDHAK
jgi:hypothetical protein